MKRRTQKRCTAWLAAALTLALAGAALAEPLGFGLVNTNKTNFRESLGGALLFRQSAGEYVFIRDHATDSQGRKWYRVKTDHTADYSTKTVEAWVMAKYVTAEDALFSDIVQVSAGDAGMLALKRDGTVVGVAIETSDDRVFQRNIAEWHDIRQVLGGFYTYFAVETDGSLHGFGNAGYEDWDAVKNVRLLACGGVNVVYVTENGRSNLERSLVEGELSARMDGEQISRLAVGSMWTVLLSEQGRARFVGNRSASAEVSARVDELEGWTNLVDVQTAYFYPLEQQVRLDTNRAAFAGLHADGTVSVTPSEWFPQAATWTDITAISMANNLLLGLRKDGTVVAAGDNTYHQSEVGEWRDIIAVDAAPVYCVGLKRDGTLVWAGGQ